MLPPVKLMLVPAGAAAAVPPQLLVKPFGVATTSPVGSVSLNATPVSATVFAAGFVIVKVNVLVPFNGIELGLKALAIDGGATTVSVSLAVFPVPPLVEDTAPEVFVNAPAAVPVTFTTTVQELLTAMLPPVRLMLVPPAAAEAEPPQLFVKPFGVATTNPVGSVSLNATPASATVLAAGFVMVKVSVLVPFNGIELGLKALAIDGGATTVRVAVLLVVPVPPSVELIAPVVLLASPAAVPVTLTVSVHEELCVTLPPDRLITPVPAVAVTVPPQVLVTPGVPATTNVPVAEGSVSLNATPVRSPLAGVPGLFGLLMVKVTVVVPLSGILAAPKALLMVGGATTVTVALAVLLFPPSVELTCTELFLSPAVVPCTFTETAHEALAANVPPDRLSELAPAVAVAVPPQVLFRLGVDATTSPAGRLSVNANPLSVTLLFGLLMLMVSKVVPFSGILVG